MVMSGSIIDTYIFSSIYSVMEKTAAVSCIFVETGSRLEILIMGTVSCVTVHLLRAVISLLKLGINSNILILAIKG